MLEIRGKTVIVTGGSAGVGLAAARRFLQFGANVAITGRSSEKLEIASRDLGSADRIMTIAWDVTEVDRAEEVFASVEERFGGVHVLVNNAGCNHRGAIEDVSLEHMAQIIDTNLRAPLLLARAALPFIRRAGGGAIVNVASLAGRIPLPHEATYSATKFGLRGFSLAIAQELEGSGISASVVSPGPIETDFILSDLDNMPDIVFSQPMSSAEQIAELILACVRDGKPERAWPVLSGWLTNAGYVFPAIMRRLRPMLVKRGRRAKAHYRAKGDASWRR